MACSSRWCAWREALSRALPPELAQTWACRGYLYLCVYPTKAAQMSCTLWYS